jgi:hypothetical protein
MKVLLMFSGFAILSVMLTSICVLNGFENWQILLSNIGAGAILGLITGMIE